MGGKLDRPDYFSTAKLSASNGPAVNTADAGLITTGGHVSHE
jgi:hypothetical protein